jgi:hypothetical protein
MQAVRRPDDVYTQTHFEEITMNASISRWSRALSLAAAVGIVLTAGAVGAADQHSDSGGTTAAVTAGAHGSTTMALGECPIDTTGTGSDAGDTAPGAVGSDAGVHVGGDTDDGTVAGDGSADAGVDVGGDTGDGTVAGDGSADAGTAGTPSSGSQPSTPAGGGTGDAGSGSVTPGAAGDDGAGALTTGQALLDLDGFVGDGGLGLTVPAPGGALLAAEVGAPSPDDPAHPALVAVDAHADDLAASDVDLDGEHVVAIGDVTAGDEAGTIGDGTLLQGLGTSLITVVVAPQQHAAPTDDAGVIVPTPGSGGAGGHGTLVDVGDIASTGGSAPLVDADAPLTITT